MFENVRREIPIIVVGAIALLFDFRITLGILLGLVFSVLHQRFLEYRTDRILSAASVGVLAYLGSLLSLLLLALPLLISFLLPGVFHWGGVFVGLMYRKFVLYFESFKGGTGDGH
ncbi:MAG: ATP synthase subunit I [Erysipelotrichaceae bacterium]|nr:ATP synthase subunit I [Erysipelotrichaceae bacterium]